MDKGKVSRAKIDKRREMQMEKQEESRYETCIFCRKATDVPKEKDISERNYYIEGAGQLCRECYFEIYGSRRPQNGNTGLF
ncbi:MAG: hypothetical protein KHX69_09670 [Clostridium sp.]|nr:hypothetical protein [Clostridium sp.]